MGSSMLDVFVCLLILPVFVTCSLEDDTTRVCKTRENLQQVRMQDECSKEIFVNSSIEVSPTGQPFSVLVNCLNCSLTLRTSRDRRLVASLYSLATETGSNGTCDLNRLDLFDGEDVSEENRLTNDSGICGCELVEYSGYITTNNTMTLVFKTHCNVLIQLTTNDLTEHLYQMARDALSDDSGICGCELNEYSGFITTNNTMTLVFNTQCNVPTQHGEFRLIVSSVKNDSDEEGKHCAGHFECGDGTCIDKNLVCDGTDNCKDRSDETGCATRNATCNGLFECENGQCIDKNLVCNGQYNCEDHSDETNCSRTTNGTCPGLFECASNRKCIDKNLVCDGVDNCGDSSDENGCSIFRRISKMLLFILVGIASLCLIFLIVILLILCWRYCTKAGKIASTYRRLT